MSMPANTPSTVLREALLEYSRTARCNRRRNRRAKELTAQPQPDTVQNVQQNDVADSCFAKPEPATLPPAPTQHPSQVGNKQSAIKEALPQSFATIFPGAIENEEAYLQQNSRIPSAPSFISPGGSVSELGDVIEIHIADVEKAHKLEDKVDSLKSRYKTLAAEFEEGEGSVHNPYDIEINGCCGNKYRVAPEFLELDGYAQSRFIQKVFTILVLKAILIGSYLLIVERIGEYCNVDLQEFYTTSVHYHYISIGIYICIKIALRITKSFRKQNWGLHALILILDIIAMSDFLACVISNWLPGYFGVPRTVLVALIGTSLFYVIVGSFVNYDMQDGIMMGSALIVTAMTAIHQILHGHMSSNGVTYSDWALEEIRDEWIPALIGLLTAELIITIIMRELQSVMIGNRYAVKPSDWFFTAIYII